MSVCLPLICVHQIEIIFENGAASQALATSHIRIVGTVAINRIQTLCMNGLRDSTGWRHRAECCAACLRSRALSRCWYNEEDRQNSKTDEAPRTLFYFFMFQFQLHNKTTFQITGKSINVMIQKPFNDGIARAQSTQ